MKSSITLSVYENIYNETTINQYLKKVDAGIFKFIGKNKL